ncbi:hypothetical protein ACJQWK_10314 [Exserohilum turcicum]
MDINGRPTSAATGCQTPRRAASVSQPPGSGRRASQTPARPWDRNRHGRLSAPSALPIAGAFASFSSSWPHNPIQPEPVPFAPDTPNLDLHTPRHPLPPQHTPAPIPYCSTRTSSLSHTHTLSLSSHSHIPPKHAPPRPARMVL